MFTNTQEFKREAQHWLKHGVYTNAPKGTGDYKEYWKEQLKRCREGYSVGGVKITGDHYFYLNFCQIKLTNKEDAEVSGISIRKAGKKIVAFPDFWDGDFNYFWCKEIARYGITQEELDKIPLEYKVNELTGGKHLIVDKARRKGYSYKNAAIVANIYNTTPNSLSLLTAFDKRYLTMGNAVMNMTTSYLDFVNEHTAWTKKRQLNNTAEHKKASYLSYINGMPIEKGYKSEVLAISFRDNPDAARGKDATLVLMEEAGKWRGMKDAYASIKPVVQDGDYTTGQIIIFGTGGKNNTDWADFKEMFYNPTTYNLLSFKNIWDGESQQSCGFFFPDYYNKPGHIDKEGNSNKDTARESEQKLRDHILKTSRRKSDYAEHIAEYCFSPAESFQFTKGKIFNIPELDSHIQYIESHKDALNFGTPIRLEFEDGVIVKKLDKSLQPVEFPLKDYTEGCIMEYEPPCDNPPYGLYTASLDPIEMEKPTDGDYSLSACIIWKNVRNATESYDLPVATYFGRPERATDCYENIRRLLKYYNAVCLYENEKRGFEWYMSQKGEQYLLKPQPNILNKIIKNSSVNRPYGTHMTDPIKDQCELWGADWLKEEFAPGFLNVTKVPDLFLLKQLSAYEREGNYDAVDAFLFAMLHKQENHYLHKSMTDRDKPSSTKSFFDKVLFNNSKMWNI